MTTISGTTLTNPTQTTLAELADRAQALLDDAAAAVWSQAQIEGWVLDAIRDYSQHFPRRETTTISTSANTREYALPEGLRDILSVEYPAGEDPPQYLRRRDYTHPAFWQQDGFYDLVWENDADAPELWISKAPAAGQTIGVHYLAAHDWNLASGDAITVPAHHEPILLAYVLWQATVHLQMNEQQDPTSNSSLLMAQLASNADRARRSYVQALARALRAAEGQSAATRWQFDKYDRIY